MTNEQKEAIIKEAVNKFLSWKLPDDFYPDCGISFNKESEYEHPVNGKHIYNPIGTNLFHAGQAEEMFRHCLNDVLDKM